MTASEIAKTISEKFGAREWYLDWPSHATRQPVVRSVNGKQQLAVPLTGATLEKPITYSIVW